MQRNGKVDFLKFIFAVFIMVLHLGYRPKLSIGGMELLIGEKGNFAVTFFFIVSGFLIAESFKKKRSYDNIGGIDFIIGKYRHYIKWYIPAFVLCALLDATKNGIGEMLKNCLRSIPSMLLLGSLGYSGDDCSIGYYIGASWYISSLFISQVILFPLMKKDYGRYINYIAPVIFFITFSMDILGHGDRISSALFRIILGQFCYEATSLIADIPFTKGKIIAIRFVEMGGYLLAFLYMSVKGYDNLEYGMIFVVAVSVIISFSHHSNYKIFDKQIFSFLGQISFPMYLLHIQVFKWTDYLLRDRMGIEVKDGLYYSAMYLFIVLVSACAYMISKGIFSYVGQSKGAHIYGKH